MNVFIKSNEILQAALYYASIGIPLFPCRVSNKAPYTANGFKEASANREQIHRWWKNWPDAIIGMPTGETSGMLIVDIDPRHGGDYSLQGLEDKYGTFPNTLTAITGGGGTHYYFRYPGTEVRCSTGKIAPGIDIKADGGYVILPPSGHQSGKSYFWDGDFDFKTVAPAPGWLLSLINTTHLSKALADSDSNTIAEGCRNDALISLAGNMRRVGMGEDEVLAAILTTNRLRCKPPLPESEIITIARSVCRYEPDMAAVIAVEGTPDTDISGITTATCSSPIEDPGPIPDDYFDVPGFVRDYMDFCLATAPYPSRPLAFAGGMTLQAFLAGRKIRLKGGIRPNIYMLALAGSGVGKDWPRKVNSHIMNHVNALSCLGSAFASGEGIQDVMAANFNMLFQSDEIDGMLRSISGAKDARYENIMSTLLMFYTSSDHLFPMRTKAGQTKAGSINQPSLTLFGTATPKYYYGALSERMLTNGFFSRMLIVDVGQRPLCQRAGDIETIPKNILETAEYWQNQTQRFGGNLNWENPSPRIAEYTGCAEDILFDFQRHTDQKHRDTDLNDEAARTVWTRAAENARKLALLYACSEDYRNPRTSEKAALWATRFVTHQVQRQLYMASVYAAEGDFHALCLKAKERLRNSLDKQMPHSQLLKRMKIDRDSFKRLIDTLLEQGDIRKKKNDSSTFRGIVYELCE